MRNLIALFLVVLLIVGCGSALQLPEELAGRMMITDGAGATRIEFSDLVAQFDDVDVVFIGEIHDDSLTHVLELALLEALHERHDHLAVAMEMFERDVQDVLNGYLAGRIDEEAFLGASRPWNNYASAYRPIVEYAREHGLPMIAMNVPRRYARMVAMGGEAGIEALPSEERGWLATELKALDDTYKERFLGVMGESRPGPMGRMDPENLYKAQCLKDDTMAESIDAFLKAEPGVKVVSYQGDFHSAFRLGIVKKLAILNPDVRSLVVSVVPVEGVEGVDPTAYSGQGDYLIFVERIEGS